MNKIRTAIGSVYSLRLATVATALLSAMHVQAQTVFTNTASGNWSDSANWSGSVPPASGGSRDYTIIANVGTAVVAATNDWPAGGNFFLNQLVYTNAITEGSYTLAGTGNLVFTNNTSAAAPQVRQETGRPMTLTNALTLAADTTFGGSGAGGVSLNAAIGGAGSLTMNGGYILTLATSNAYTGGTVLNAGTLKIVGNSNTSACGTNTLTLGGGTLNLGAFATQKNLNVARINVTGAATVVYVQNSVGFGSSLMLGSGTLNVSNPNVNANNLNLGTLTDYAGTINVLDHSGAGTTSRGGTNVALNLFGSGIFLTGVNLGGVARIGALSGDAGSSFYCQNQAATFQIGALGSNTVFAGTIKNINTTLTLVKVGGGILTLSGNNTYAGTTTISDGTLWVNGTHTNVSVYNVASNATLGGVGVIGSTVTNLLGGTLAPGTNSIGTLGTGNLTLNGKLKIRVGPAGASKVSVTGAVVLGSDSDLVVEEAGQPGGGPKVIVENDGTADAVTGQFKQGTKLSVGGNTYTLDYAGGDGNDITLTLRPKGTMIRFF